MTFVCLFFAGAERTRVEGEHFDPAHDRVAAIYADYACGDAALPSSAVAGTWRRGPNQWAGTEVAVQEDLRNGRVGVFFSPIFLVFLFFGVDGGLLVDLVSRSVREM